MRQGEENGKPFLRGALLGLAGGAAAGGVYAVLLGAVGLIFTPRGDPTSGLSPSIAAEGAPSALILVALMAIVSVPLGAILGALSGVAIASARNVVGRRLGVISAAAAVSAWLVFTCPLIATSQGRSVWWFVGAVPVLAIAPAAFWVGHAIRLGRTQRQIQPGSTV